MASRSICDAARAVRAFAVALAVASPSAAFAAAPAAAAPPTSRALDPAVLKRSGDQAMESGDYAKAASFYADAYERTHDPVLLFNLGRARQFEGDFAAALRAIERFQKEAPEDVRSRVPKLAALVEQLRAKTALLSLTCDVAGARVAIDGREAGQTPLADPTYANLGPGHVTITADGYAPFAMDVRLDPGQVTKATAQLELAQSLRVEATPAGSAVAIDGAPRGIAPVLVGLAPGKHRVEVAHAGFTPTHAELELKAGQPLAWSTTLAAESAPLVGRWWFWTAVGVAVAGATAGVAVAATSHGGPHAGSLAPGVVLAPSSLQESLRGRITW
jgi:hypothetical protein